MSDLKFRWLEVLTESQLPDKAVRVGAAVWSYTDKYGRNAYPGYEKLAKRANVSVATVKRMLKLLRDAGMIQKTPKIKRAHNDNYYLVLPTIEGQGLDLQFPQSSQPIEGQSSDPQTSPSIEGQFEPIEGQIGPIEGQSSDPLNNQVLKGSLKKQTGLTSTAPTELHDDDAFRELLKAYPRSVPKDEQKAIAALRKLTSEGVTLDVLVGCAHRYAAECREKGREVRFIKYPSRWLADGWRDFEMVTYRDRFDNERTCMRWEKKAMDEQTAKAKAARGNWF